MLSKIFSLSDTSSLAEALNSVTAAKEMKKLSKHDKALRYRNWI